MVVSIVNISPAHGSRYYTQEGHRSEADQQQHSSWSGRLTQIVGVSGAVASQPLAHLLKGKSPTGELLVNKSQLHRQQDNARKEGRSAPTERAGLDLTASAPKSISIQALVLGDVRLVEAHRRANERMLQFLEENYACTRLRQDRQRIRVRTGQLAIAQFHHDTSRALDPQLHTHNLILNLQQRPDGKWQSLDNTAIYQARSLLGKLYRNELAREVEAMGYEIAITHAKHEFWELKGYSRKQLEQFSKRAKQIQTVAGESATPQEKAWITMTLSRQEKQNLPRSDLLSLWQQEAIAAGILVTAEAFAPVQPEQNQRDVGTASPMENHPFSSHNILIRGLNDFQRDENQISAAPAESGTRQHDIQPADRTEALYDRTSISQFRATLRSIATAYESEAADGGLGELESANFGDRRTDGATHSVAQADASLPDYPQTNVGESAAADRRDVYSSDHSGAGVGYPDDTAASEPEAEENWEWERNYRQSH